MKISNLLDKDFKIVEKKKIFFLIPAAIVLITAICMLIYGLVLGSPVNLGMDFTGGYSMDVRLGTKLTADNTEYYDDLVTELIESAADDNGTSYGVKVSGIQHQGEKADEKTIHVTYNAAADSSVMSKEINPKLQKRLQSAMFNIVPQISDGETNDGKTLTLAYEFSFAVDSTFNDAKKFITESLAANEITVKSVTRSANNRELVVLLDKGVTVSEEARVALRDAATIDDRYSGIVSEGDAVSKLFSTELLWTMLAAILSSVVLMLIYIMFRFEFSSAVSAIVALFHDILIMFCAMVIFRIPITSTFIAALITILGYSINNTLVIFDRVRENKKSMESMNPSAAFIANKSVTETFLRSVNTTVTTLLTIGMVAILGVTDIKIFAFPIIIGLIAGAYSSVCIAPSIWASWKSGKKKAQPETGEKSKKAASAQ